MSCSGAYAAAWQFAAFFCLDSLRAGTHDGAGPADAALLDNSATFLSDGAEANVGQVLYNITAGTSGPITAITDTSLTATGVTWNAADRYRVVFIDGNELAEVDFNLELTAGNIHAARAATGGCDCTLAGWASDELSKLNVILAGVLYNCRCVRTGLDNDRRAALLEMVEGKIELIRSGKIELCEGATAVDYPAWGIVEQSSTPFAAEEIILNRWRRSS